MKSLERMFQKERERNMLQSSYLCFAMAIKEQNFHKQVIQRWFDRLVDKDDYFEGEKEEIVNFLCVLTGNSSNPLRNTSEAGILPKTAGFGLKMN